MKNFQLITALDADILNVEGAADEGDARDKVRMQFGRTCDERFTCDVRGGEGDVTPFTAFCIAVTACEKKCANLPF